ncbi:MAG TPA: prolipoprotein diacylglyceryl transferase family protein, partial [Candidatus Izemoplasmatales bacterium]|nr:prolipoprotein diacylglyceryl transferase family protein [Candidatus Izemoplasmatales bacterium]
MTKTVKILLVGFVLMISFSFVEGLFVNGEEANDTFTVTFVDHDGRVLKTIGCDSAPCEIVPPSNPNNKENAKFLRWSVFEEDFENIDENTEIKAIYNLDNRIINLGGSFAIQAYSFFIVIGLMVGLTLGLREMPRIGMEKDDLMDGFLWIVPLAILGARLWYVIFEWDNFIYGNVFSSLLRIIGFQNGQLEFVNSEGIRNFGLEGLAIHGAFVTAVILVYVYTRKKELDIFKILDVVAVGFIIAQAFGRWGNFFNQEAHGGLVGGMSDGVANL